MQLRFDCPVAAFGIEQPLRIELLGARAGDEIAGFFHLPTAAPNARAQFSDLRCTGEADFLRGADNGVRAFDVRSPPRLAGASRPATP